MKPETKAAVAQIVEEKLKRPLTESENAPDTTFAQLGMDSLDAMEVTLAVEQRFGFTSDDRADDARRAVGARGGLQEKAPPKPPPAGWFDPPADDSPLSIRARRSRRRS